MIRKVFLCMFLVALYVFADGQDKSFTLREIWNRDPCILPVEEERCYYFYKSSSVWQDGVEYGGVVAYTSRDLVKWEGPVRVFDVPRDNYLTGCVWAPEVHKYNGAYYLFATLNSDISWKRKDEEHSTFTHRGTQIFRSESPEGPFLPFKEKRQQTPLGQMCLDGTLWVENDIPYMIYCREWVETHDGEMCMVELSKDLSTPVGEPIRLFCASSAEWCTSFGDGNYVTDGCFLYRTSTGKLLMIWSSMSGPDYVVGIAESATGRVHGPWRQQKKLLYNMNGGHGMIFRTFDGRLCLTLHAPNSGAEPRAHLYELKDTGETLILNKKF